MYEMAYCVSLTGEGFYPLPVVPLLIYGGPLCVTLLCAESTECPCCSKALLQAFLLIIFSQKEDAIDDTLSSRHKVKELSVIDGRRAQNCNILLSRYG